LCKTGKKFSRKKAQNQQKEKRENLFVILRLSFCYFGPFCGYRFLCFPIFADYAKF
jgi:hypothetical protein